MGRCPAGLRRPTLQYNTAVVFKTSTVLVEAFVDTVETLRTSLQKAQDLHVTAIWQILLLSKAHDSARRLNAGRLADSSHNQ